MKISISAQMYLYLLLIITAASGVIFPFLLSPPDGLYLFIVVASIAGLGVAINIYRTKRAGKKLVCPTGSNCDAVTGSKYSRFFGISLEYWGIAYFTVIAVAYLALIFFSDLFAPMVVISIILLSVAAGFFSIYLLFVQAFLLRQWCIWCLLTAFLSLSICVASFASAEAMIQFLNEIGVFLMFLKFLGFAIGVGGISSASLLFFHFLKDEKIDEKELDAIQSVLELVWTGLGFVLVSIFAQLVAFPELFTDSLVFVLQLVVLFVAVLSGAVLMLIYAPFLVYVPFGEVDKDDSRASFSSIRRPAVLAVALTLVSWYFAFSLEFVSSTTPTELLSLFVALLFVATAFVLWWDARISSQEG